MATLRANNVFTLARENPYRDDEFLQLARKRAKSSTLIVINHALLVGEYSEENVHRRLLSPPDHLIIDEAHTLEASVTDACRESATFEVMEGALSRIEQAIRRHNSRAKERREETFTLPEFPALRESIILDAGMVFDFLSEYFFARSGSRPGEEHREILREDDIFLHASHATAVRAHEALSSRVLELSEYCYTAPEALMRLLENHLEILETSVSVLARMLSEDADAGIHTLGSSMRTGSIYASVMPLRIGAFLSRALWSKSFSCTLTSATLRTAGSYDSISKLFGLEGFRFETFDTEFDYAKQALCYIPTDLGDTRRHEDKKRIHEFLARIIAIMGGRTLALFTSFQSIREAYLATNAELKASGIRVIAQGFSGGKQRMLADYLRTSESSVIYGTDTFWQGVDIPGRDLELLVIHKLPFTVPADPVFMARSRLFENPFREYAMPQMILKLRQGIGRLIRSRADCGIIVILDARILSDW